MRHGEGFVCVYDITSRNSFEEIMKMRKQILMAKNVDTVPMVLVGNKADLEDDRNVTTAEGKELAKSFGCEFLETSAKTGMNITDSFYSLVRCIREEAAKKNKTKGAKKHKHCKVL